MICRDLVNRIYTQPRMNGLNGYLELARMLNVVTNVTYYVECTHCTQTHLRISSFTQKAREVKPSSFGYPAVFALCSNNVAIRESAMRFDSGLFRGPGYGLRFTNGPGATCINTIRLVFFALFLCEKIVGRISDPPT